MALELSLRSSVDHHQPRSVHSRDREYVPPDGGYGWVCVVCIFFINAHTWGFNFAYGIFLDFFLANDLYPGATSLDYALIGGLSTSMSLVITPLINTSSRRLGLRPTLVFGLVLLTASLVGASFATQVWQLYLSQGACFGWGLGFLYVGSSNIVPQWFSKRRSLANGISAAGAPFGGIIYSLAISSMLEGSGPAWTFRILAICAFTANLVAIVLLHDRNKVQQPNQSAFNYRLLKRLEIWLVVGWGCLSELGYTILLYSLPNYARRIGLNAHQGSVVGALINLGLFIGRPSTGYLSDTWGGINMATATTGLCGVACLIVWIFSKSFGSLCFFAIVAGMLCGTFWASIAPIGADVAGLSEVPSTLSVVLFCMAVPTTFAEPIGLAMRRSTGDIYLDVQIFTGFMFIGASICNLFLRGWKIRKTEEEAAGQRRQEYEVNGRAERQSRPVFKEPDVLSRLGQGRLVFRRIFQLKRV
ncbi:MFS transporter-like protein [Usnea florida]